MVRSWRWFAAAAAAVLLEACPGVSLRGAFPAPDLSGGAAGVILPVEDRSGSHGAIGEFEPPLAQAFAEGLRWKLSEAGVPMALAATAANPWQAQVPDGATFILAAQIRTFELSMSSEGTAEVAYAAYAPGNPAPLRSWSVRTVHSFLDRRGVSTIAGGADMTAAVKTLIEENAAGATPDQPEGNAGLLRMLGEKRQGRAAPAPSQPAAAQAAPPQPAPARQATGLLAVLEFKNKLKGRDAEAVDAGYFSNAVRAAVKRESPAIRVMTRENVIVLLQSAGKSLADCEGECEVDTGRRLGADWIISGDILKVGSSYKIDLRLHDTRDGQLLNGTAATGHDVDQLDKDMPRAIAELLGGLRSR